MRILLLSYHFYNHTAEGQVTAKLVKALVEHGHQVVVIASDVTLGGLQDESFLEIDNDNLSIYRVGIQNDLGPWLWRFLDRLSEVGTVLAKLSALPNLIYGCSLSDWIWINKVSKMAERILVEDGPFNILHTRINPPVNHFIALELKKKQPNLAWCAYFSDPWPFHLYPKPYHSSAGRLSRKRLEMKLDQILNNADSLIFPSEYLIKHMLKNARAKHHNKAFNAPHLGNTWDKVKFPENNNALSLRHAGFLMRERRIEPLYDGLREFLAQNPEAEKSLRIEFAGRFHDEPEAPSDLREVIRFHGYIQPDKLWHWLQGGDAFLLVEANLDKGIFFPSKLAQYLSGQRFILALGPKEGVAADMLAHGGGLVVAPDDVEGISQALSQLFRAWQDGTLAVSIPPQHVRDAVSPQKVIPIYEWAFEKAIQNRGKHDATA